MLVVLSVEDFEGDRTSSKMSSRVSYTWTYSPRAFCAVNESLTFQQKQGRISTPSQTVEPNKAPQGRPLHSCRAGTWPMRAHKSQYNDPENLGIHSTLECGSHTDTSCQAGGLQRHHSGDPHPPGQSMPIPREE